MAKKYKCPYCDFIADDKVKVHRHVYARSDKEHGKFGKAPSGYSYELIVELGGDVMENENSVSEEKEIDTTTDTTSVEHNNTDELADIISKLESKPSIVDELMKLKSMIEEQNNKIADLEKRLDVHKEALLKILKELGVE